MNEQHYDMTPPVDLPKPVQEPTEAMPPAVTQESGFSEQAHAQALEHGRSTPAPNPGSQPGPSDDISPTAQQPVDPTHLASVQSASSQTPLIADDVDLIEKEWVFKAKQIVEQTKDDPYNQNKQINEVKADYLKKRYNRDLKIAEDK